MGLTSDTCSSIICCFVTVQGSQPLVSICVFSSAGIILIFSPSIFLLFLRTKYVAAWKIFLPYFMYCIYLNSMQVFSWESTFVRGVEPIILLLPNAVFLVVIRCILTATINAIQHVCTTKCIVRLFTHDRTCSDKFLRLIVSDMWRLLIEIRCLQSLKWVYTVMRRITTFQSTDRIYDGGPIKL